MASNPFDQFDASAPNTAANPFDQFDQGNVSQQTLVPPGKPARLWHNTAQDNADLDSFEQASGQTMPNPFSALIQGVVSGGKGVGKTFGANGADQGPQSLAAQPYAWGDVLHPETLLSKTAYSLGQGAPTIAGGVLGTLAGAAVPGAGETGASELVGGGLGAAAGNALQTVGPVYQQELQKTPNDRDGAFDRAMKRSAIEAGASGIGWAAFGYGPFRNAVKNALFQTFGVQPAISVAANTAENVAQGNKPFEGAGSAYASGVASTALPLAGHAAAGVLLNIARGRPADAPVAPTGDSAGANASAANPFDQFDAPKGQPPSGTAQAAAPQTAPAMGDAVGLRFKSGPPQRGTVDHYFDNGNAVRLRMDDGTTHDLTTQDFLANRAEPPAPTQEAPAPVQRGPSVGMDEAPFPDDWGSDPTTAPPPPRPAPLGGDMLNALDHANEMERRALDGSNTLSGGERQAMLSEVGRLRSQFGHDPNDADIPPNAYRHPMAGEPAADLGELAAARVARPDLYQGEYQPSEAPAAQSDPDLAYALEDVQRAKEPMPQGETLFDAIRAMGGIRDNGGGDINQIMTDFRRPGMRVLNSKEPFARRVVRPDGLDPDTVRSNLQQDGWWGKFQDQYGPNAMEVGSYPGDDISDLHDMMDREARGEPVYHPDSDVPAQLEQRSQLEEDLGRAGVGADDPDDVAAQKLADYRKTELAAREAWQRTPTPLPDEEQQNLETHGYEPGADIGAEYEEPGSHEADAGGPEDWVHEQTADNEGGERTEGDNQEPAEEHAGEREDVGPGVESAPQDFEEFANQNGASALDFGDAGLHRNPNQYSPKVWGRKVAIQKARDDALARKREALMEEYEAKVAAGEIRPKTNAEKLIETARGHPDNASVQAARRVLEKRGIDWQTRTKFQRTPEDKGLFATEPGAVDAQGRPLDQTIIPGGEQTEAQRKASMSDRAMAEMKARQQQSKLRRGDQQEPGGMFAEPDKQGTLFQRAQEQTPEFKNWFGDSKVVDAEGNPMVVYHGTDKNFKAFDPKKATMGGITWFTSDRGAIESGDVGAQGKGRILDLYASIKNPAGWAEYDKFGLGELKSRGYDGAILPDSDGTLTGFVFEPTQLKSASQNRGTFDPNQKRLDLQVGAGQAAGHGQAEKLSDELIGRALTNPSPEETRLLNRVEALAEKIVPRASVRVMRSLDMTPEAKQMSGLGDQPMKITGATYVNGLRRLIAVSMESPDALGTLSHEALHYLRGRGLISPKEWNALDRAMDKGGWLEKHNIAKRYPDADPQAQREEAVAEELSKWARAPDLVPKMFKPMYERIARFMAQIGDATRRMFGKDVTADDVMSRVMTGEVGNRNTAGQQRQEPTAFQRRYTPDDYKRILESQRELEGMRAAMRDPKTGKIYSAWSHQGAIEKAGAETLKLSEDDPSQGAYSRLSDEWDRGTDNTGFMDRNGNFVSRDDANKRWGVLTMEDIRDLRKGQSQFQRQLPQGVDEAGDREDAATDAMAEAIRSKGPGTYARTLSKLSPPSGERIYKDPNAVQNVTLRPETMARLDTRSGAIWNAEKGKEYESNTMVDDLRQRISDTMLKLDDSQRNNVYAARELDRINGLTRTDTGHRIVARNDGADFTHYSKPGQVVTLSPEETNAYHALTGMFDRAWKNIMEGAARKVGWEGAWDKDDMAANIKNLNDRAENAPDRGTAKSATRAAKIVTALDEQRRQGYHPLMRFGDYYAHVTPKVGTDMSSTGGFPKTLRFELAERGLMDEVKGGTRVGDQAPAYAKEMLDRLNAQYPSDKFNVEHGFLSKNPDMLDRVDIPAIEKLMTFMENDMLSSMRQEGRARGLSKEDAKGDATKRYDDLYGALIDRLWDKTFAELESGYRKRANTVPGYDSDFDRALGTYMHWTSRTVADQIHRPAIDEAHTAMETDPNVNANVKQYWKNWRDYQQKPSNIFNKSVNGMARWGFLTAMGVNPSSTGVVGTHGLFMAGPTLSVGVGMGKAAPAYARAMNHAMSAVTVDRAGLRIPDVTVAGRTPAEKAFLKNLDAEGVLHSRAIEDMSALNEKQSSLWGSARSSARKVMDAALSNVSVMDRANRIASALSSYRLAGDPTTLSQMDTAWKQNQIWRDRSDREGVNQESMARFMVPNMVGEYGPMNQAPIERNAVSRMMLGMHGFVTRLLGNMWKLGSMGPEGQKALLWTGGAFWLMAGLNGLPFVQDAQNGADMIWKGMTGKDPMLGYRIQSELASVFGKMGAEMILRGPVTAFSGVDTASRLGLGDLITRNWPTAENTLGAYPSIILGRAEAAARDISQGNAAKAATEFLPAGIRNVIRAGTEAQQGVVSGTGRTEVPASHITAADTAARAAGFTPERAERAYEANDYRYRARHSKMGAPPNPIPGYKAGGKIKRTA